MSEQVEETGQARYRRLQTEAKDLGISTHGLKADEIEAAIKANDEVDVDDSVNANDVKGPTGLTPSEAKSIEARLRFEEETRGRIIAERKIVTEKASLIAESESLCIPIDLPDNPTEIDLARARRTLGVEKLKEKPSLETLAIEAGKKGYYIFNNLEDEDATHSPNLGGKYPLVLIPGQVHVLSDYHVKKWRQIAVKPIYERIPVTAVKEGDAGEICQRTGSKPRWSFEYIEEAPVDAVFGLVTDAKILEKLTIAI